MKNNFLKILTFIYLLFFCFLSIYNREEVFKIIFDTLYIWLYKVFPPIFIFYIISSLLISSKAINILFYIFKPLKRLFKFETDNAFKLYILSVLIGNPSTSLFIISYLNNNNITENDAVILNKCSSFITPLFIFSLAPINLSLPLYLSHIVSNFILCIILTSKNKKSIISHPLSFVNFFDFLEKFPKIIFSIAIFMIICNLLTYSLTLFKINEVYLSIFELSSGVFKILNKDSIYKYYYLLALISFNGLCIHLQVYSIIKDRLNYLSFFKYRIIQIVISIILFLLINTYFT